MIGSGSASYELVRSLVESLPLVIAPPWVETAAQPIAIEDVLEYLVAALEYEELRSAIFEIGGADRVTYADIIREYARQRGLRRPLLRSSLLTPRLTRFFLGLITPVYGQVAGALVDGLRNETVVRSAASLEAFPIRPRGLRGAVERALINEDLDFAETSWSDALASNRRAGVAPTPSICASATQSTSGASRRSSRAAGWVWRRRCGSPDAYGCNSSSIRTTMAASRFARPRCSIPPAASGWRTGTCSTPFTISSSAGCSATSAR